MEVQDFPKNISNELYGINSAIEQKDMNKPSENQLMQYK